LAVSKSDLADEEILAELKKDLPEIPTVFISSHQQTGLDKLKNVLWEELNRQV
jgi:GTP-binding protein